LPQFGQPFFYFNYVFWGASDLEPVQHRNPEFAGDYVAGLAEVATKIGISSGNDRLDVFPIYRIVQEFDYLFWNSGFIVSATVGGNY
jgi:hypothetical protein